MKTLAIIFATSGLATFIFMLAAALTHSWTWVNPMVITGSIATITLIIMTILVIKD